MKLDIYGSTQQDIRKCKDELTGKLQRSLQTMIWSEKPSYEQDRKSIIKLSQLQVCCSNSLHTGGVQKKHHFLSVYRQSLFVYRQNCIFVCLYTKLYFCMFLEKIVFLLFNILLKEASVSGCHEHQN